MRISLIPILLFAASATADDVHLKDGRVLSGTVLEESARYVIVDRDWKHAVKKSEVEKIVKRRSFMDEFEQRLETLPEDDAEAIYEFGRWLEGNEWPSRARRAYEEVIEVDPDHRGARRALGYKLYEGEWVSPDELNRRKGLVEFEGRWYTKHDLAEFQAEIQRNARLRESLAERREVNRKVSGILRKFTTLNKKRRQKAYEELNRYAEQINSPQLRKFADDTKAYYDAVAKNICAQLRARVEIHATHTQLRKPIETFETTLGAAISVVAAQNPVKIQLPELTIAEVRTTVDIPADCE
jgi:hypothetical protein